ncbi:hypothetical protein N2152v2_006960 [Parachlorella kessleri]
MADEPPAAEVEQPRAVWLDCDPGYHPQIRLIGISTVAGNQTVEKVTHNALAVLAAAGLSGIGTASPFTSVCCTLLQPILCPEIHGESGLDGPLGGPVLPPSEQQPVAGKAPNVMFERISQHFRDTGQRVHLVAVAALTNVALLLMLYPEVLGMVEVVIMGGCMGVGNTGPVVEFNIQTDPEAAKVVFESGARLTMVPLEVTHTAVVTTSILQRIRTHRPSPFLTLMVTLLMFFADTYKAVFRFNDPPLHDPCAVAYVVAPKIFQVEHLRVDVETGSTLSAGQTVTDIWHQSGRPKNVHVCMAMDVEKFWEMMIDAIHRADLVSPLNKD